MQTQHILQNQLLKPRRHLQSQVPLPPARTSTRNIVLMNSVGNIAINLKWQEGVCVQPQNAPPLRRRSPNRMGGEKDPGALLTAAAVPWPPPRRGPPEHAR